MNHLVPTLLLSLFGLSTGLADVENPFAKENAPKPERPAPGAEEERQLDLLFGFETYRIDTRELDRLLSANPSGTSLHSAVLELYQGGRGVVLEDLQSIRALSGQRSRVTSVHRYRQMTAYHAEEQEAPRSTAWEEARCGAELEIDPVLHEDEIGIDVNLALSQDRMLGFRQLSPATAPATQIGPQVTRRKVTTAQSLSDGEVRLLAIQPASEKDGQQSQVTFGLARLVEVPPGKNPASDPWRLALRVYKLDRALAREVIATTSGGKDVHEKVRSLHEEGKATLEGLLSLPCRSGQRASIIRQLNTPQGAEGRQFWSSVEPEETGWEVEVDPVLGPNRRMVYVNLAITHSVDEGDLEGHELLRQQLPTPVQALRSMTTSISCGTGETAFIGTLNQPQDTGVNGNQDGGTTSLAFLEIRLPGT